MTITGRLLLGVLDCVGVAVALECVVAAGTEEDVRAGFDVLGAVAEWVGRVEAFVSCCAALVRACVPATVRTEVCVDCAGEEAAHAERLSESAQVAAIPAAIDRLITRSR